MSNNLPKQNQKILKGPMPPPKGSAHWVWSNFLRIMVNFHMAQGGDGSSWQRALLSAFALSFRMNPCGMHNESG